MLSLLYNLVRWISPGIQPVIHVEEMVDDRSTSEPVVIAILVQDSYKYLGLPQTNGNYRETARKSATKSTYKGQGGSRRVR